MSEQAAVVLKSPEPVRDWKALLVVAVVVATLAAARSILAPLALSIFLALLAFPMVRWLEARKLPRALALALTLCGMFLAVGVTALLVGGALSEIRAAGPRYFGAVEERLAYTLDWWSARGVEIRAILPTPSAAREGLIRWATGTARGALEMLVQAAVVSVTTIFLLFEGARFRSRRFRLPPQIQEGFSRIAAISSAVQRYLWIKTLMAAAIGLAAGAWLEFLGVDLAVLFGLLAFGFHFVPNVGAFLAAVPPMLLALVQHDPAKMLSVAAGYACIGMVLGNFVEPALLGRRLGMSALAVWLSLVIWGWLWGPLGMFLSVPLTLAWKSWLELSPRWAWLATLLEPAEGSGPGTGLPGIKRAESEFESSLAKGEASP